MTWAVNDAGSSFHSGVENNCVVGETRPSLGYGREFFNRGVQWDTRMARWADEAKDWINLLT